MTTAAAAVVVVVLFAHFHSDCVKDKAEMEFPFMLRWSPVQG